MFSTGVLDSPTPEGSTGPAFTVAEFPHVWRSFEPVELHEWLPQYSDPGFSLPMSDSSFSTPPPLLRLFECVRREGSDYALVETIPDHDLTSIADSNVPSYFPSRLQRGVGSSQSVIRSPTRNGSAGGVQKSAGGGASFSLSVRTRLTKHKGVRKNGETRPLEILKNFTGLYHDQENSGAGEDSRRRRRRTQATAAWR